MDGVEREFEKRDANIYDLEGQVRVEKSKVESLDAELQKASRIIESQKGELGAARKMQKTLVEQCEHVEGTGIDIFKFSVTFLVNRPNQLLFATGIERGIHDRQELEY